jgi:peptide/nickel transport system permease protein
MKGHILGTDYLGRDVLLRAVFATRTAVKVGVVASLISSVFGVALGLLGGYYGGKMDAAVLWIYSTFASIPSLLFILAFALLVSKGFLSPPLEAAFQAFSRAMNTEPGMMAVYLGIGLTGWVPLCRVVRAETLRLRTRPYVTAARALGVNDRGIMLRHILPNLMHLVIVYFTMRFAFAVMTEVIVSYLGLGVKFEPSWGLMISNGQSLFWRGAWWEIAAATGFMFVLVLALNMTGDALRDALDPRHTSGK